MTAEVFNLDPRATTSADWQEENKAKREQKGAYFGDRVKRVEGTAAPCEDPADQYRKPIIFKPAPTRINVAELGPLDGQRK